MIARDLGRTHTELLAGTSARELSMWKVLYAQEGKERQEQQEKAQPKPKRR